ncbi:hypothetical protein [Acinetobacter sp.]|uniref:hypothetical protein n=1 Tax=Acinetobacter sp. TaxID=472 RepID=UPI000C0A2BA2|nr:hypothetical protein [Acinetobacter sp.]MAK29685.1 hypothetical protein [Acinetobacter sp.]|tara:strand:+ start:5361 stop:5579 length:219 start_codon:yes stop_codon:yes gene_type:complete
MAKKPLTGPMKYGDSKEEKRRALDDATRLIEIIGHPGVAPFAVTVLGPIGIMLSARANGISKVLKKMKKTLE